MIELSFIIGCLLIVLIGVYLMKANQLFIDEQNLNIRGFVAVKVANF